MKAIRLPAYVVRFALETTRRLAEVGFFLACVSVPSAFGQTFVPTAGTHAWNDPNNWSTVTIPDSDTATANIPEPTGDLTINLSQPNVTVNGLNIDKPLSGTFSTTIAGGVGEQLTFAGAAPFLQNAASIPTPSGTGKTLISAPVSLGATLTVTQRDNDELQFNAPISGAGGLTILRSGTGTGTGDGTVVLGAANSYMGVTSLGTGSTTGTNFLVVRLNDANSIPGGTDVAGGTANLVVSNSVIIALAASDFRRGIGTAANQISFSGVSSSGFAAIGAPRVVNFGNGANITWNATFIGQNNTFVLGAAIADNMVDVQNNININNTANRTIRAVDGSAAIDGRISGVISGAGNLVKTGSGTLSLNAVNTYAGTTLVDGGVLRLDKVGALPNGALTLQGGGVLGLGAENFARPVGTAAGQVQFATGSGGNASNAGFAAMGGYRTVLLNGDPNSVMTWDVNFVKSGGNFVLSDEGADNIVEFQNRIDLAGAQRTFAIRDGSSSLDARITNVISGTGTGSTFNKTQGGALELSAANTYEGNTIVGAGVLVLTNADAIPRDGLGNYKGNISFTGNNARIGLGTGDFTASLGTGPGQVQFVNTGDGGFAAYGADRVVNLGGASAPLTWGTGDFAPQFFMLGSNGSDKTVDFQNPVNLNGALRTIATREGGAAIEGIMSGEISGTGGLQKNSPGAVAFTAANTYDGGTTVNEGKLYINNTTGSGVGVGDVTVNSTGTLAGSGFIGTLADISNVNVLTGGHLAPGNGLGQLSEVGNASLASGSFFDAELGGNAPGTFDRFAVAGAVNLSGTLTVTLANSFTPTTGNSFELIAATGGVTGTFENVSLPTLPGIIWQVVYNPNSVVLATLGDGIPGDYNNNGAVDAADYILWRNGSPIANEVATPGSITQEDYDAWRARYGNFSGSGSAVPEPSVAIILMVVLVVSVGRRCKARDEQGFCARAGG
jgi:autotransporter-associated beta strand protein